MIRFKAHPARLYAKRLLLIAALLIATPASAEFGLEAGTGRFSLQSQTAGELTKSGLLFQGLATWRQIGEKGTWIAGAGFGQISAEGTEISARQKIRQQALLADAAYFLPEYFERISLGAGFRSWIGYGTGMEFLKPDAFKAATYVGPRVMTRLKPVYIQVSYEMDLNLSAGSASALLLNLGYRFE